MSETPTPLLELRGITKSYGSVQALTDVDFEVRDGEVMALVGDNGAGKTTLIKIISGDKRADAGELRLDGKPVTIANPREARELGIETVYQDLALADHLDAAANLFLGREEYLPGVLGWLGFLDRKQMRRRAEEAGTFAVYADGEAVAARLKRETEAWVEVVKRTGIKPD